MKPLFALLVLLSWSCVVRAHHPAPPPVVVQVSVFDAHLEPYGSWLVVPTYGRVWKPAIASVGPDFYPYGTGGSWRYTDAGWVFESEYPFGWAVFHYGRWYLDPQWGWLWVPGDTWGPAWVMWRTGGVYVGWAPLGPAGAPAFHHHHWCFVDAHHFRERDVRSHHVHEGNFHAAVAVTTPVRGAAHEGPPPAWLAETTRQPPVVAVPVLQLPGAGRVPPPLPRTPPPPPRDATPPPPPRDVTPPPPPRDVTPPPPPRDVTPPPPRVEQPPPARLEREQVPLPPRDVTPPPPRVEQPPPARLERERVPLPAPPARVEPPRPAAPPPPARLERGPSPPTSPTPGTPPPPQPQKKDKVPLPPKGKVVRPPGP